MTLYMGYIYIYIYDPIYDPYHPFASAELPRSVWDDLQSPKAKKLRTSSQPGSQPDMQPASHAAYQPRTYSSFRGPEPAATGCHRPPHGADPEPLKSPKSYEIVWHFLKINGNRWTCMKINENQHKCIKIDAKVWQSIEIEASKPPSVQVCEAGARGGSI